VRAALNMSRQIAGNTMRLRREGSRVPFFPSQTRNGHSATTRSKTAMGLWIGLAGSNQIRNTKDFADSTVAKVRMFPLRRGPNLAKRFEAASSERRKNDDSN
jgi:hypothetical protein